MDIDKIIERRLKVLDQCLIEAMRALLEAYDEKVSLSHLFYMEQDEEVSKTLTNS